MELSNSIDRDRHRPHLRRDNIWRSQMLGVKQLRAARGRDHHEPFDPGQCFGPHLRCRSDLGRHQPHLRHDNIWRRQMLGYQLLRGARRWDHYGPIDPGQCFGPHLRCRIDLGRLTSHLRRDNIWRRQMLGPQRYGAARGWDHYGPIDPG